MHDTCGEDDSCLDVSIKPGDLLENLPLALHNAVRPFDDIVSMSVAEVKKLLGASRRSSTLSSTLSRDMVNDTLVRSQHRGLQCVPSISQYILS